MPVLKDINLLEAYSKQYRVREEGKRCINNCSDISNWCVYIGICTYVCSDNFLFHENQQYYDRNKLEENNCEQDTERFKDKRGI